MTKTDNNTCTSINKNVAEQSVMLYRITNKNKMRRYQIRFQSLQVYFKNMAHNTSNYVKYIIHIDVKHGC